MDKAALLEGGASQGTAEWQHAQLTAAKDAAVASGDYAQAASLKQQIDSLPTTQVAVAVAAAAPAMQSASIYGNIGPATTTQTTTTTVVIAEFVSTMNEFKDTIVIPHIGNTDKIFPCLQCFCYGCSIWYE